MKYVILVFTTDAWHTRSSRELMGVFSSYEKAIKVLQENYELSSIDLLHLKSIKQTQAREVNFILECVTVN
jgi:hypothetical protein